MSNEMPKDEILSDDQLDAVAGGVVMNFNDNLGGGASNPTPTTTTSTTSRPSSTTSLNSLRQSVASTSTARTTAPTTTAPSSVNPNAPGYITIAPPTTRTSTGGR